MNTDYKTIKRIPTLGEFKKLCYAVGWKDYMNFDVAEDSLRQSVFCVVIEFKDQIVGMGRVVGDGKIYFYIQDIVVLPDHQDKGVGKAIMTTITEYLKNEAPEKAFIGLFASQGKEQFYKKFGFNVHDGMTGMFGVIRESAIK